MVEVILFYLIRIDDKIDFLDTKLETWEKLVWIFALGLINLGFSIVMWGISTSISASILVVMGMTDYSLYFVKAMFPLLVISFLLLPAILYSKYLAKQVKSRNIQMNELVEMGLVGVLALSLGNYLLFWSYYDVHDPRVLIAIIALTILALKMQTPFIKKSISLIVWIIKLPLRIVVRVIKIIRS